MLIKANKRENRLNLKILFLLCVFIILTMVSRTLPAAGADGSWRSMEAMLSERWDTSAVVIRGKIYVIGKIEGRTPCIFSVTEYNPVKNSWLNVIKYSRCFTSMTAAVVRGKIYVIGGMDDIYNQYSWVWEHNPVIGSWRNMADMLTRRSGLAAVAVREKIYAIGGIGEGDRPLTTVTLATVEEYNPTTDTWRRMADMPTPRHNLAVALVNEKIYVLGGLYGKNHLATVEEYDPATDTWRVRASMPTARSKLVAVAVGGRIYAIGGRDGNRYLATVEEYDPATNSWQSRTPMPTE